MRPSRPAGEVVRFPSGEPAGTEPVWGRLTGVLVMAVVLVASVVWGVDRLKVPEYGEPGIEALPGEAFEVSRADPVLRWSSLGPDVVYTVEVLTDELHPVALAHDLEQPEYRLPDRSRGVLRGTAGVVWRVQARYPDGRERLSRRFHQRLSGATSGS